MMTVHRAKGLEFPIVILADPTCNATSARPQRHVDPDRRLWAESICGAAPVELLEAAEEELRRDADEAVRVAYVAATRARDLLVIPGIGDLGAEDEMASGWLDALNPAIYPTDGRRGSAVPAPGCPAFGEETTVGRPAAARLTREPIRPGMHAAPLEGGPAIVWWDPSRLKLGVQEEVGLRQSRILEADEGGVVAEESRLAHDRWAEGRTAAIAAGSVATLTAAPIKALALAAIGAGAAARAADARSVAIESVEIDPARPAGTRFGTLVHAVLAAIDLDAGPAAIAAATRTQARLIDATAEEIAAAAVAVERALAHPLLRRAAQAERAGGLRRETPVVLRLDDGSLAEGVIDLAFRDEGGDGARWTVVDFKTDRDLSQRRDAYEMQVALYARAIATATGEAARAVLLAV
jgi:ATP-dependent exoDNAse (exonuclease V) beta subunit